MPQSYTDYIRDEESGLEAEYLFSEEGSELWDDKVQGGFTSNSHIVPNDYVGVLMPLLTPIEWCIMSVLLMGDRWIGAIRHCVPASDEEINEALAELHRVGLVCEIEHGQWIALLPVKYNLDMLRDRREKEDAGSRLES